VEIDVSKRPPDQENKILGDSSKLGSEPIWIARVPKEYVYIVMVETREEKHIRREERETTSYW
jgi:hypothetical protein